ncbi:hypothetical protein H4R34_002831 [Dimargaris verticillata]|uniref:STEEP1 domain-containing protein n=1 Tax=Dimargaris verticillata TaxID=2761393 RepID=A0A9W8B7B5_9FUNG|nr:hypothetical protein H4R34_002831 [Dimargaris verticillata]
MSYSRHRARHHRPRPYRPDQRKNFNVYYCLCGEYNLILERPLAEFPQRATDQAYIINNATNMYKWNVKKGTEAIVKRESGYEKQLRFGCPRCELTVGYNASGDSFAGDYTYIIADALTAEQGVIPEALQAELNATPVEEQAENQPIPSP